VCGGKTSASNNLSDCIIVAAPSTVVFDRCVEMTEAATATKPLQNSKRSYSNLSYKPKIFISFIPELCLLLLQTSITSNKKLTFFGLPI
jgi:hypothetical protein